MLSVDAHSVEEYFDFDLRRAKELRTIDGWIRTAAPTLERWFVPGTAPEMPGMTMRMIGYGRFSYTVKSSSQPIDWPVIGLALQKNTMSLYLAAQRNGQPLAASFASRLGKVSVGSSGAISFTRAADFEENAFRELLIAVSEPTTELRYGRARN